MSKHSEAAYRRPRVTASCITCGKPMVNVYSSKRTCSTNCRVKLFRKNRKEAGK